MTFSPWWCIVSLEASLGAREVWGLWLMLKAFAPVTWRKEIRARCQQISTSTWLTRRDLALRAYSQQSHTHIHTKDSGVTQVIFQWLFYVKVPATCLPASDARFQSRKQGEKKRQRQWALQPRSGRGIMAFNCLLCNLRIFLSLFFFLKVLARMKTFQLKRISRTTF